MSRPATMPEYPQLPLLRRMPTRRGLLCKANGDSFCASQHPHPLPGRRSGSSVATTTMPSYQQAHLFRSAQTHLAALCRAHCESLLRSSAFSTYKCDPTAVRRPRRRLTTWVSLKIDRRGEQPRIRTVCVHYRKLCFRITRYESYLTAVRRPGRVRVVCVVMRQALGVSPIESPQSLFQLLPYSQKVTYASRDPSGESAGAKFPG